MRKEGLTKSFLLVLSFVVVIAALFSVWFVVADHTVYLNSNVSNGSTWLKGGTNQSFNFTFGSTVANTSTNLTQVNISNANFTLNLTSPIINVSSWSCTAYNATLINCSGTNQSIAMNITVFAELPLEPSYEINHSWLITSQDNYTDTNSTAWLTEVAVGPTATFGTNPVHGLNLSATSDVFEFKCADDINISQIKMYSDFSGSWAANYTNYTNATNYPSFNNSWVNITRGLANGYYVWAVWCNDSVGLSDWTTNRTLTIDTTAPAVSLMSPADGHTTLSSTKTFIYRVTDAWEITSCEFIFDGLTDQTDTSIARGVDQEFTKSGMGTGAHTWTVKCTDESANSHTATAFNIRIMSSGAGAGGGGAVGGAVEEEEEEELPEAPGEAPTEFDYDLGNLIDYEANETNITVEVNQTITFVVKGETHTAQVSGIGEDSITIWIWSDPITTTVNLGETNYLDLDANGMEELALTLHSVVGGKATLSFREIQEVPVVEEEEARNLWWLWIIISILIIAAVVLIIMAVQKRK